MTEPKLIQEKADLCFLGNPGVGKTRLASTFPNPFFIDIELGAGSAVESDRRMAIPPTGDALAGLKNVISGLKRSPYKDGIITLERAGGKKVDVAWLVIDSIDGLQDSFKYNNLMTGKDRMTDPMWGLLLDKLYPIFMELKALPIGTITVAQARTFDTREGQDGPSRVTFSAQGQLAQKMPRWFDYIFHIAARGNGTRYAMTQPTERGGYFFTAKDRHDTFLEYKDGIVDIPRKDGKIDTKIADTIVATHRWW